MTATAHVQVLLCRSSSGAPQQWHTRQSPVSRVLPPVPFFLAWERQETGREQRRSSRNGSPRRSARWGWRFSTAEPPWVAWSLHFLSRACLILCSAGERHFYLSARQALSGSSHGF